MNKTLHFLRRAPLLCIALALMMALGALTVLLPKSAFSELENRPLASLAGKTPLSPGFDQAVETWVSDHFPFRSGWVKAHAAITTLLGRTRQSGVLLGRGGALMEEPVREVTATARMAASTLNEAAEALQLPMSLALIPTSAQANASALPALYENSDQLAVIRQIQLLMPDVQHVTPPLHLPEHYYRTDHHLTAEGAWQVYLALCDAWGLTPIPAERTEIGGMRGSYYARIPSTLIEAEPFTAVLPAGLTLTVDGAEAPFLNPGKLSGRSKYAALIGETYAHAVITGGTGDERLLILSDSYINAIAPLLSQHFARVDIIDPRYYADVLVHTAQEAASTRVLALMGLNTFSANRGLAYLTIKEE